MEKINYSPNGQWDLEKAEPKNMDHYGFGNHRPDNKITDADAQIHQDVAHKKATLHSKHSVKQMKNENGEIEDHIMLHRGITHYDPANTNGYNSFKIDPTHVEAKDHSVNTLLPDVAHRYSINYPKDKDGEELHPKDYGDQKPTKGKVFSFWVPKSKIHHMGGYTGKDSKMDSQTEDQKHTSTHPGKFQRATPEEVQAVTKSSKKPPLQ